MEKKKYKYVDCLNDTIFKYYNIRNLVIMDQELNKSILTFFISNEKEYDEIKKEMKFLVYLVSTNKFDETTEDETKLENNHWFSIENLKNETLFNRAKEIITDIFCDKYLNVSVLDTLGIQEPKEEYNILVDFKVLFLKEINKDLRILEDEIEIQRNPKYSFIGK